MSTIDKMVEIVLVAIGAFLGGCFVHHVCTCFDDDSHCED